jgi:hypothetical protein
MKFFFDNNIGDFMVFGLRGFGENVCHLTEHFAADTADEAWLEFVGQNEFFLLTRDKRIRRRPLELDSLKRHRVGAFILVGKQMGRWAQIEQVVHAWPKILETAASTSPPFAFRVDRYGSSLSKLSLG